MAGKGTVALVDLGEHQLADLARPERVFGVSHPDRPAQTGPLIRSVRPRHNLPAAVSRFLGRNAELAELENLLAAQRMLTLWGSGGAGKTRLSLELAAGVAGGFPDGVWFVELAPLDRAELVAPAVMSALGMLAGGGSSATPAEELRRYLATRQALIVLDNCEHLLAPAAELAHAVLTSCPGVRVLTSSREPLGVAGECIWAVPPLSLPRIEDDLDSFRDSDAVVLFCDRARAAHPGYSLTEANAAGVGQICRALDGIPLALELAAARVRVLGVNGLAERLGDRLRLLTSGPRTAETRHRTLRAAVDWSYELLPVLQRNLLARLAVFPASFDLAAAETVGTAVGVGRGPIHRTGSRSSICWPGWWTSP